MGKAVIVERTDKVVTLQLNRPENLNALNLEMGEELAAAVADARLDSEVKAVVITGAGRAFCAGGDLQFFANWEGPTHDAFAELVQKLNRIIMDLRLMPKPVIAAINGVASGAGLSLAAACDLRIASEGAKFKQAYTSVGLSPDGGWTISVARQIGLAKASELLLLDPVFSAEQALDLGLINQVVPSGELLDRARQIAEIAVSKPPLAIAQSKALLNQALGFGMADQLEAERDGVMNAGDTTDFADQVSAFLAKKSRK